MPSQAMPLYRRLWPSQRTLSRRARWSGAKACRRRDSGGGGQLCARSGSFPAGGVDAGEVWPRRRLGDDDERLGGGGGPLVERHGRALGTLARRQVVADRGGGLLARAAQEAETSGPDQAA